MKVILKIGGMSCSGCSSRLEKHLNSKPGIKAVVNLVLQEASIEYDSNITITEIENYIKEVGFESLGVYNPKKEFTYEIKNKKRNLIIYGILTLFLFSIVIFKMLGKNNLFNFNNHPVLYAIILFIFTIPYLIYGFDIFKKGFKSLFNRSLNMDTLVTLGVFASFIYSFVNMILIILGSYELVNSLYFESCCVIIFFIKLGRFIDYNSKEKTKEALKELVQITPLKALLKKDDYEKEVTIDEVKKGDILIAKPGMKIAVDGVIKKGKTHVDEAFLTGEALPARKNIGDKVLAGSINVDGYIEYEAVKIGSESTISNIVKLVIEATSTKAPIQRIADKVCSYFVPSIIIIALLTFIAYLIFNGSLNEAILRMVTVLVIACPCALGLATPLALVVAIGSLAKEGILIKNSEVLENVNKITTVVFDKTGTLTYGNLKIAKVFNYSSLTDDDLLKLAISMEIKSSHPIAKAFIEFNKDKKYKLEEVEDFLNIEGIGIKGKIKNKEIYLGNSKLLDKLKIKNTFIKDEEKLMNDSNSLVYLIENKKVLGLIGVSDIIRENAKNLVLNLKKMQKDIIMLTGDNKKTANIVAKNLAIDNILASLIPSQKVEFIKNLIKDKKKVMMVGDGINDAPSLALSLVSVSFESGTDIAINSSDVILLQNDILKINRLFEFSKKTLKIIKENLFWAFFYNICMIPIAIGLFKNLGININPMLASFAMMLSSLTVVFNSLRLRK